MNETHLLRYDQLTVEVHPTSQALGETAAENLIREVNGLLASEPAVHIIFATGNSMLGFYDALRRRAAEVDWQRMRIFHMDEYVGMAADHPASFRRYLHEHIIDNLQPLAFYEVIGDAADSQQECDRYATLLRQYPPHICCLGIGENGHIAFNDPPYADFDDPLTVKVVRLAEQSRRQQVGEGHFASLVEVPQDAITLTIPALLASACVIGIVPEARKAQAVKTALEGEISEDCPASILVSGLTNIETNLRIERFPLDYYPVAYPCHGIRSNVSGVGYNLAKALTVLGNDVHFLSAIGPREEANAQVVRLALASDGIADDAVLPLLCELYT